MMTHEELDKIPEILITDEMVEKGFDYLCDHDWGDLGEFNASRQHVVNLLTLCLSGHPLSFDPNLKERPE